MDIGDKFTIGANEYKVTKKEGEGGFSIVFKAEPVDAASFDPPLAVKVLLPSFAADNDFKRRFDREARILANIDHPNVVKIRATFTQRDGSLAIIQDFVEGAVSMRKAFRMRDTAGQVSIVLQVLYGLRASHGIGSLAGAIHRDLSPDNILIDPTGIAKIIDFGLARPDPRDSTTITKNYSFGTTGCIAPEQLVDAAVVDQRADLYALGRTVASSIQDREPMHADCSKLPQPWKEICERLAAHDAADRHADCTDAIRDIISRFALIDVVPADAQIHFNEFSNASRWPTPLAEWPAAARLMVTRHTGSEYARFGLLFALPASTFREPSFDLNGLFPTVDAQTLERFFREGRGASFGSVDRLGNMLIAWMPHLDRANKILAFARLVRTAVDYNRFHVMGLVRRAFAAFGADDLNQDFLGILEAQDTERVIEGRDIIPGR